MSELSFKEQAIEELISSPMPTGESALAFISAVAKNVGTISLARRRVNLVMTVDSYGAGMFLVEVLKSVYPTEFEISADEIKVGAKKGERSYSVAVQTGFTKQVLLDTEIMSQDEDGGIEIEVPKRFSKERSLAVSYVKGLFLACGSVYVPSISGAKKDGYHFEFRLEEEESAISVLALLAGLGVSAKMSERGSNYLVYLKDKAEIVKVLEIMGLGDSVMKLQRIIDERETANALNRMVICETANLDKTYVAASKHLLAIGIIEDRDGLSSLSPELADTARARMEYPQASMQELAEIIGVSKSCLNHRLRRLIEIAGE